MGLRAALDAAGHSATKIVLPDCAVATDPALLEAIATNETFGAAFEVAGLHGDPVPVPILEATGHKYWQSESGYDPISLSQDWPGAQQWAQNLIRNYVVANITGTVTWSTIWSVLPGLPYDGRGLMMANTPWSGNFADSAPLWVTAHFGQFLQVGWRHLLTGRGAGILPLANGTGDAGSYAAFVPASDLSELTLIVETMGGAPGAPPREVTFQLLNGLPGPGASLAVWQTTDAFRFVPMPDAVVAADGTLTLSLPSDGIVTASTLRGAAHGRPSAPVPPSAPLPLPYRDSFDEADCAYDQLPRYLSDQGGSFACRNGSLAQVVTMRPALNDWYTTPDPITLLGDYVAWDDVIIGVTAAVPPPAEGSGLGDDPNASLASCEASPGPNSAQRWSFGEPAAGYVSNTVSGMSTCLNLYGCMPRLIYFECCQNCGCADAQGFIFVLQPNASLTSPLLPGLCAGVLADNVTVSMVQCEPGSALQRWTSVASTRQLVNAYTGTCMTSTLKPLVPYLRVCARVTGYTGFNGLAPVPGYCLVLASDGSFTVLAGPAVIGNGTVGSSYSPAQPTALELTVKGDLVSASVGGAPLGSWPGNGTFTGGMIAIGSGVHAATFDDLSVAPAV